MIGSGRYGASRRVFLMGTGASAVMLASAEVAAVPRSPMPVAAPIRPILAAFDMADVDLHDGPFLHAQRLTEAYLLRLDPDRMLHAFRVNAGLKPRAPAYGGWESEPMWADINCHGHTLGHYLSACALAFRSTRDQRYAARIEHIAGELAACQAAADSGLVTAFPDGPALMARHLAGQPITGVPWYTLHKLYAGLRDAALLADSRASRAVLIRLADWGVAACRPLTDAQFEAMLATEHGGMNEVYADLFAMTGKAQYRDLSRRFSHKAILDPLAKGRDHLDGLHANTQVPKITGFHRVYETTGDATYRDAARFFWRTVARTRSFATGGHGDAEHFFAPVDTAAHVFSPKASETCCQHNMLRLTRAMFLDEPRAEYGDYYERTLYNGILASQDPNSGMATYFQGAKPGYMKLYHTPEHSFWCCTGTGMENHVKYRDSIYFKGDCALYVNLFIPSAVHWAEAGAVLTQATRFPDEATTRLRWAMKAPAHLTLALRHPGWSRTAVVRINGTEAMRSDAPGRYLEIAREWRDGDEVTLDLAMEAGFEAIPAARDIVAFTYGPLVLAGTLGRQGLKPGDDIVVNERKFGEYNDVPVAVPQLAGDPAVLARRIRPAGVPLTFTIPAADGSAVRLIPYHRIAHERYATYWKLGRA